MSRVDALWARMAAIYPHTWTSALGDNPAGIAADTWAAALAGITPEQLAEGLRACVVEGREFPPSAGRFRAMCLGIPTLAAVKAELLTPAAPRSRFVLLVWRFVDAHAIRLADQRTANRMLADAYDVAREQVMRGADLPEQPVAQIAQDEPAKPKPPTPEVAAAALAEARELLGPPPAKPAEPLPSSVSASEKAALEQALREHYERLADPPWVAGEDGVPRHPHDARACAFADADQEPAP